MKYTLWKHQQRMVDFARDKTGTIFDCCMGGGKTLAAIHLLEREWKSRLALILAPKAVVGAVWPSEFAKYVERKWRIVPLSMNGTTKRVKKLDEEGREWWDAKRSYPMAIIVNYEALREPEMWQKMEKIQRSVGFDVLVCDELHRCKGHKSQVAKVTAKLAHIRPRMRRLGLTGTLMPHSPLDLWAQMRIINQEVFGGSFFWFKKNYSIMGGFGGKQVIGFRKTDEMMDRCKNTIIRITEEDANLNLPEVRDEFIMLDLSKSARKLYDEFESNLVVEVADGTLSAQNGLVKSLRLAQITSGFAPFDTLNDLGEVEERNIRIVDTAKYDYLVDLFRDSGNTPTICFCTFRPEMDMVHRAAKAAGVTSLEVSGRRIELDNWKAGESPIIVAQIKAGSEGVDLTRSAHCVFVSVGNNGGKYQQARKRAHRPGQKFPVLNTHLTCRKSVDSGNMKSIQAKKDLADGILEYLRGLGQ